MTKFRFLRGRGIRKKLWQLIRNPRGKTRPVFVIGCGRSGTSMLIFQLAKSWDIDLYNENHPKAFQNWRLRQLSDIERLIKQSSAKITLFKPILNTPQTPEFLARFPDSKIIFCFRNYSDVINSSIKRFGLMNRLGHVNSWKEDDFSEFSMYPPPENTKQAILNNWSDKLSPEEGAALYWLFYNRLYFDLNLDKVQRVLLVQYETLVSQPEDEIKRICRFIDLKYDPKMGDGIFTSSVRREPVPSLDPGIKVICDHLWDNLCDQLDGNRTLKNA